jgi:hypothetical protein
MRKCLDKKGIIIKNTAVSHLKIYSEIDPEVVLRKTERDIAILRKTDGVTKVLIIFHCISTEN